MRRVPMFGGWNPNAKPQPKPEPDSESDQTPDPDQDEHDRLNAWRHEQLLAAGMTDPSAFMVAILTDVDLHQACDLVRHAIEQGRDPEDATMLALEILL